MSHSLNVHSELIQGRGHNGVIVMSLILILLCQDAADLGPLSRDPQASAMDNL